MIDVTREFLDAGIIRALEPGIARNWAETGGFADLNLDIDWDVYRALDDVGLLYVFVGYDTDTNDIAGFLFYIKSPGHPHDKKVPFAIQDTFYVEPEYRKSGAASAILGFAEQYLRRDGIGVVSQSAKPGTGFNVVLLRKGYEHTDNMYLKRL